MPTTIQSKPIVIETAGAALFVSEAARDVGYDQLAQKAGAAAMYMQGIHGLSDGHREDVTRVLSGSEQAAAEHILANLVERGGSIADAAEAVLVELTDPERFWREINEAKEQSRMAGVPDIPDTPASLAEGLYPTGPVSRVDLPPIR